MPLSPDEFFAHAAAAADAEGRLPLSRMTFWEIFPFEPDGLRVVPLRPAELPEPDRHGAGGVDCFNCSSMAGVVWYDENWVLRVPAEPGGAPLIMMLNPRAHFDLGELPDDLAAELGVRMVHVARAVEALPHTARAHVSKWGDGGEHLHVFFYARPAGFSQLRGSCLSVWDDLLPATPTAVRDADARAVVDTLVDSLGGAAGAPTSVRERDG